MIIYQVPAFHWVFVLYFSVYVHTYIWFCLFISWDDNNLVLVFLMTASWCYSCVNNHVNSRLLWKLSKMTKNKQIIEIRSLPLYLKSFHKIWQIFDHLKHWEQQQKFRLHSHIQLHVCCCSCWKKWNPVLPEKRKTSVEKERGELHFSLTYTNPICSPLHKFFHLLPTTVI